MKKRKCKRELGLFLLISGLFALPSILYGIEHKTIVEFEFDWTYFYKIAQGNREVNAMMLFLLFSGLFILYVRILKNHRQCLETPKKLFGFIGVISFLFLLVIPYAGKDVYSYIAHGWLDAHYHVNPYAVSVGEVADTLAVSESMFEKIAPVWRYEKLTYGPLWAWISKGLCWLSFGNILVALLLFKMVSFGIHMVNCVFIYRITRKKLHVLLYGLNPALLFEALSNVHNDFYMVLFFLLGLYFVTRKKKLFFSVASFTLATAIKYVPILILPFALIYSVREKRMSEKIKICVLCVVEFVAIFGMLYGFYWCDFEVFSGLFLQQEKMNSSLFYLVAQILGENQEGIKILKKVALGGFIIWYGCVVIKLLVSKKVTLHQSLQKYHAILLIFTFVLITNFNSWYLLWLFPTLYFLKGETIKNVLYLSYGAELANIVSFVLFWKIPYFVTMLGTMMLFNLVEYARIKGRKGESKL